MASIQDPKRQMLFGGKPKDFQGFVQKARQDALGNKIPEPEEEVALLEKEIQDLKVIFEQYFLGMERKAPLRRRDVLGERLRRFKSADVKMSTLLKHRVDHVHAKFTSFDRVWTRTIAEMEAGTYKRDLFKMKLRQRPGDSPAGVAPGGAPATKRPAGPPAALSDGQLKAIYDAYVTARQRTNEPLSGLTLQTMSSSLLKQVPELMKKHNCKAIDFKVVIKDNKAVLKAVPRQ